jgi:hypothetical protein
MAINKTQRQQLDEALTSFLDAIRLYIIEKMSVNYPEDWGLIYAQSLSPFHKKNWDNGLMEGKSPKELIDFGHLKQFVIDNKQYFKEDFKRKTGMLPTWFEEISLVRNDWAHNHEIELDDASRALGTMVRILQAISMGEIAEKIKNIRVGFYPEKIKVVEKKVIVDAAEDESPVVAKGPLLPWFMNVRPHEDIERGNLDESVFAANLGDVALGTGREVYRDPEQFFPKTYFTAGLKNLARQVIRGLNGHKDAENRVISLQTGFGGGKTHSLISLYHLIKKGKGIIDWEQTTDIIDEIGKPDFENANVAVVTNTTNDPTQGRTVDGVQIKTIWGELAWQLGGREAYEIIGKNDESQTAPKGLFKKVLEKTAPCLILIDELADYCVAASGVPVGALSLSDQTISFIQELSESISSSNHCVAVVTLPASPLEVASSEKGHQILVSLTNRLSRVGKDTRPVEGDEIFEVIRRRLFEDLGDSAEMEKVVKHYYDYYKTLDINHEIPLYAARPDFRERIRKAYPFHPQLIDIFESRWASHSDFQRTRGVLRMLGSIVADLWKRQSTLVGSHGLIHVSDMNLGNLDAITSQIKKLWGNGYDAVISADVSGNNSNAFKIDNNKQEYRRFSITQGVATAIMMGTFGSDGANKGLNTQEIKLMVLKPDTYNHNSVNGVLDALESEAHYLHYSEAANIKRYWFHTRPNINILINQAKGDVQKTALENEIINRIKMREKEFNQFNVLVAPSEDLPEQTRLTLVIAHPSLIVNTDVVNGKLKPYIEKVASKRGNNERIYKNTILFLVATELGINQLHIELRELIACNKIKTDYSGQISQEQKTDLLEKIKELNRKVDRSLCVAYSLIIKAGARGEIEKLHVKQFKDTIDVQFNVNILQLLKDEEWLLEGVGFGKLQELNLIPTIENPVKVKDVYEAFLRYNDKPMITGVQAIQNSLLRLCNGKQVAIAQGEPGNFTKIFLGTGVPYFDVTSTDFWLVDKSLYQPETPDVPAPEKQPVPYPEKSGTDSTNVGNEDPSTTKEFKTVIISGKVDVANYSQVFTSFINPLMKNNVEITITIKGKNTNAAPLAENSQHFKIIKESASQLGLDFEAEE